MIQPKQPSLSMKHYFLAGILTTITAITSPYSSKASPDIAQTARISTVLIEGATEGSGVLVRKDGNTYTVITAWHVIKMNRLGEEIMIKTPDGKGHRTSIVNAQKINDIDLASITFSSSEKYTPMKIGNANEIRQGDPIYVAGFPLSTTAVPNRIMRFLPGQVIAYSRTPLPDGYQILYTNATLPGMSGGSVLSSSGLLIGIHGRGETDSKATEQSGVYVKTGTNLALPINLYKATQSTTTDTAKAKELPKDNQQQKFEQYLVAAANTSSLLHRDFMTKDDITTENLRAQKVVSLTTKALKIKESAKAYELRGLALKTVPGYRLGFPMRVSYETMELEMKRQQKNALADLSAAIRLEPSNGDLYIKRGTAYDFAHYIDDTNRKEKARSDYRKAIELMPSSLDGYIRLENSYKSDSKKKKIIETVLRKFPRKSQTHVMHGDYLRERPFKDNDPNSLKQNTIQAKKSYERALTLDDSNWDAYYGLASISSTIMWESEMYRKYYLNEPYVCSKNHKSCIRYRISDELRAQGLGSDAQTIKLASASIRLAPDAASPMAQLYSIRAKAKSSMGDTVGACRDWKVVLRYDETQGDLDYYCK